MQKIIWKRMEKLLYEKQNFIVLKEKQITNKFFLCQFDLQVQSIIVSSGGKF
jgi:hypothetical protein